MIESWHTAAPVTNGVIAMTLARISGGKDRCDVAVTAPVTMAIVPPAIFVARNFDPNIICCNIASFTIPDAARSAPKIVHHLITVQTSGLRVLG